MTISFFLQSITQLFNIALTTYLGWKKLSLIIVTRLSEKWLLSICLLNWMSKNKIVFIQICPEKNCTLNKVKVFPLLWTGSPTWSILFPLLVLIVEHWRPTDGLSFYLRFFNVFRTGIVYCKVDIVFLQLNIKSRLEKRQTMCWGRLNHKITRRKNTVAL